MKYDEFKEKIIKYCNKNKKESAGKIAKYFNIPYVSFRRCIERWVKNPKLILNRGKIKKKKRIKKKIVNTKCSKCKKKFKNAGSFTRHKKACRFSKKDEKKIKEMFFNGIKLHEIHKKYGEKFVKETLKGLNRPFILKGKTGRPGKKHTEKSKQKISKALKKAHKEKRAANWQSHKSYPNNFFDKVLTNNGYVKNDDYFREFPFSIYRADFFFFYLKLVIEIDGSQHFRFKKQQHTDRRKEEYLKSLGIDVVRIPWKVLFNNSKNVIDSILKILKSWKKHKDNEIILMFNKKQLNRLEKLNKIKVNRKKDKIKKKRVLKKKLCDICNKEISLNNFIRHQNKCKRIKNEKKVVEMRKIKVEEQQKLNIQERRKNLKDIDLSKFGWVAQLSILWGISHSQVRRFMIKYYPEEFEKAFHKKQ